jgi:hypothetical protein
MHDCTRGICSDDSDPDGCGDRSAVLFFESFIGLGSLILLNLFVAVLLDNFESYDAAGILLSTSVTENFIATWQQFDPCAKRYIPLDRLEPFLQAVGPPLGFGPALSNEAKIRCMMKLRIPVFIEAKTNGKIILYGDVYQELASLVLTAARGELEYALNSSSALRKCLARENKKQRRDLKADRFACDSVILSATLRIQRNWRARREPAKLTDLASVVFKLVELSRAALAPAAAAFVVEAAHDMKSRRLTPTPLVAECEQRLPVPGVVGYATSVEAHTSAMQEGAPQRDPPDGWTNGKAGSSGDGAVYAGEDGGPCSDGESEADGNGDNATQASGLVTTQMITPANSVQKSQAPLYFPNAHPNDHPMDHPHTHTNTHKT